MKSDKSICDGGLEFSILGGEISVPPLSASFLVFMMIEDSWENPIW